MIRVIGQNRVDFLETAGRAGQILTDAKDFCLSFVQQILGFASAGIHGVIDDVVTTRTVIRESVEIFEAAGLFFETALTQDVVDRQNIGRLSLREQALNVFEN